ncbi:Oidioi.mRNA.OKI2018_I69.chr2.g4293.t1.cds [Oikopleura dioica]|uniref:Oidioi.mRNA.OKI2018_I69.chr2.g4293.t1.cds n=1 Tax=Oikopleura dioica TaxID=34765 RepID=A0ABN7T3B2_OIKDI|nr:Oidioi.mRNA.OKI2018_I69.chr2.g4293.t1.cds [Oikopleura dioica]
MSTGMLPFPVSQDPNIPISFTTDLRKKPNTTITESITVLLYQRKPLLGNVSEFLVKNQSKPLSGPGAAYDNVIPDTISKISRDEHRNVLRARKFAMDIALRFAQRKQQEKNTKMAAQQLQRQRAVAIMCKIYVGSIYYEIGEATIRQSFETFGPVRSIDMSYDQGTNRHKGFCFLEFECPEAAFLALEHMQSITIGGRAVKVGRLSNIGQVAAQHFIAQFGNEAAKYHRVYVANIHANICDDDIKAVFESFGRVLSCQLVKNVDTGRHKHYGFVEYDNAQSMKEAISAMNGFDLGGQCIRVGPCVVPPSMHNIPTVAPGNASTALSGAKAVQEMLRKKKKESGEPSPPKDSMADVLAIREELNKKARNPTCDDDSGQMKIAGGAQRNMIMRKLMTRRSNVIVLRNMLTADELDEEVESEVTQECSQYGSVQRVVIYQEVDRFAPGKSLTLEHCL